MRKIRLLVEYDGTAYQGWQIQKDGLTIQGILEDRIQKITGKHSRVVCAGRTDAGVHALNQVAAFRSEAGLDLETIKKALNAVLPRDIRILDASETVSSFNPRDDAVRKSYFYIIVNQRISSAFLYRYSWIVQQQLEPNSMIEASQVLVGRHDFSSFMGTGSSIKDPVREIFSLNIDKLDEIDFMTASLKSNFIRIRIVANGFLRHMVRNIVGTLVEIGRGRIPASRMKDILASCDRRLAGPTAPAQGLFLERIEY